MPREREMSASALSNLRLQDGSNGVVASPSSRLAPHSPPPLGDPEDVDGAAGGGQAQAQGDGQQMLLAPPEKE